MPRGQYQRPGQKRLYKALEALSLVYPRVPIRDAFALTGNPTGAALTVRETKRRSYYLPPGCRMTATHFEFN